MTFDLDHEDDSGDPIIEEPERIITAKPKAPSKRNLVYKVPDNEKAKCLDGKWTTNYQGGETYCIDGFSYLVNNHRILKKNWNLESLSHLLKMWR